MQTALRWSLNQAAEETGYARQTVKNRIIKCGFEPDENNCFTTTQILAALFGDYEGEKTRKTKAEADLAEMERDERTRALIPAEVVQAVWLDALANLRGVVMNFDLDKKQRHQLLELLRAIPLSDYKEATTPPDDDDPETDD